MKNLLKVDFLKSCYNNHQEKKLFGRWIHFQQIAPLIDQLKEKARVLQLGKSENKTPIFGIQLGSGKRKILIWSQMHGNESTGTKAVFDLLNTLASSNKTNEISNILKACTILCIPMLNPDGALKYTRENANQIDLNRDAVAQKAVESKLLRQTLESFHPDFCFNLHDQRTIFGVSGTKNPASISFLAPSEEISRKLTESRKKTMNIIVAMNELLQQIIPNHVGRYTDEFYPTATGDNFQQLGFPTILIEAGHYTNDYDREQVRKFNFYALLQGIYHIALTNDFSNYKAYFKVPNNEKSFVDLIEHNASTGNKTAYQYQEQLIDEQLVFVKEKVSNEDLTAIYAHKEITTLKK